MDGMSREDGEKGRAIKTERQRQTFEVVLITLGYTSKIVVKYTLREQISLRWSS